MKGWTRIADAIDRLNDRLGRFVCWLTLAMVLIASYNAIARYLGRFIGKNLTSNSLLEAQWYLFSIVFLLGAAYTLKQNGHVRVDVVYDRLGPRARAWINLAGAVLFLLPFSITMIWCTWKPVTASWSILEMSSDPGGLPRYPIKTLIPIAFFLLILQGAAEIIRQLQVLRKTAPATPSGEADAT
jgi:TRAP-type mannitol/chloroaromatic compound transport system permease small subunit